VTEPGRGQLLGGSGGGEQHAPPAATTLRDLGGALDAVARVLEQNDHRGNGWQQESVFSHVVHCRAHCETWADGRRLEDLIHGACRALMALQTALVVEAGPEDTAA